MRGQVTVHLEGQRFNRLTVLWRAKKVKGQHHKFVCVCVCVNLAEVESYRLQNNHTKSCGCSRGLKNTELRKTHGHSKHPLRKTYNAMVYRCHNKLDRHFNMYGGRGISVDPSWLHPITGFENFITDMGEKPSSKHTLDRRDNHKGYSKENCRWATKAEQQRNMRSNVWFLFEGLKWTQIDLSNRLGISVDRLYHIRKNELPLPEGVTYG